MIYDSNYVYALRYKAALKFMRFENLGANGFCKFYFLYRN